MDASTGGRCEQSRNKGSHSQRACLSGRKASLLIGEQALGHSAARTGLLAAEPPPFASPITLTDHFCRLRPHLCCLCRPSHHCPHFSSTLATLKTSTKWKFVHRQGNAGKLLYLTVRHTHIQIMEKHFG